MANLISTTFRTNGDYVNIAEVTGVTIQEGETYSVQVIGNAYLCHSTTKPITGGFLVGTQGNTEPFGYTADSTNNLWIKTDKAYFNLDGKKAE